MMQPVAYRYIFICRGPGLGKDEAGRPFFDIQNRKSNETMGEISWYPTWRRWVVRFREDSVWSSDCLADVQDYIRRLVDVKEAGNAPTK